MASHLVKHAASVGKSKGTLEALALLEQAILMDGENRFGKMQHTQHTPPVEPNSKSTVSTGPKPAGPPSARRPKASFSLHVGASLRLPGVENLTRVPPAPKDTQALQEAAAASDPFAGLPLHALAEYLGDRVMPALEAAKEEQKKMKREAKLAGREVPLPELPYIPPLLPVTRWASNDPQFRSTLVVEEGAQKKARLSWYHPDDTMVPREWFSRGLLDDLRYFNPFGLGSWMAKEATK